MVSNQHNLLIMVGIWCWGSPAIGDQPWAQLLRQTGVPLRPKHWSHSIYKSIALCLQTWQQGHLMPFAYPESYYCNCIYHFLVRLLTVPSFPSKLTMVHPMFNEDFRKWWVGQCGASVPTCYVYYCQWYMRALWPFPVHVVRDNIRQHLIFRWVSHLIFRWVSLICSMKIHRQSLLIHLGLLHSTHSNVVAHVFFHEGRFHDWFIIFHVLQLLLMYCPF